MHYGNSGRSSGTGVFGDGAAADFFGPDIE